MALHHEVRELRGDELRAAAELLMLTFHRPPVREADVPLLDRIFEPGRSLGVFDGGELIGTAGSFGTRTLVPGGATPRTAAINRVAVRADHTRRGVLTALMRAQLDAVAAAGEPLAQLRASEGRIYGRYGYGVASRQAHRTLDSNLAALPPELAATGPVRLLDGVAALELLPDIYARCGPRRAGIIDRPDSWWANLRARVTKPESRTLTALHGEPGAEDGYASYEVNAEAGHSVLRVSDFCAGNDGAYRDLLRYVLGVDLVHEVRIGLSAVDEPVELMLTDRRACKLTDVEDEIWLRLVDVPEALAQREYGAAEPVVLEVRDAFLPVNSGRYRITVDGAYPVTDDPELTMDVDTLAAMYLGDTTASVLATAGQIGVVEAKALQRADRLFATHTRPWCGTFF